MIVYTLTELINYIFRADSLCLPLRKPPFHRRPSRGTPLGTTLLRAVVTRSHGRHTWIDLFYRQQCYPPKQYVTIIVLTKLKRFIDEQSFVPQRTGKQISSAGALPRHKSRRNRSPRSPHAQTWHREPADR